MRTVKARRARIHLIKPVGGRRRNAEVDSVWEVTPGIFADPITYVLECKYGLVRKRDVDDFFEVLRWSKDFGVDSPEGRQIRQGVIGTFAGSSFDPRENVKMKDETTVTLTRYAKRMNIQLLRATDFNQKLWDRGFPKSVTVQKICRASKDEENAKELLDSMWDNPNKSQNILQDIIQKNKDIFDFEKMLVETGRMQ